MKESDVQRSILELLHYHQIYAWRNNSMGVYDKAKGTYRKGGKWAISGVSDILGILPDGRFLAIEVKRPGGKASAKQLEFIEQITSRGGVAFVADSTDVVRRELSL